MAKMRGDALAEVSDSKLQKYSGRSAAWVKAVKEDEDGEGFHGDQILNRIWARSCGKSFRLGSGGVKPGS